MASVAERFTELEARLRAQPETVAGKDGVYQLELTGDGGGVWHIVIADSDGQLVEGPAEAPVVSLRLSTEDFLALTDRQLDPVAAFMSGRLTVTGDMSKALTMQSFLR